MNLRFDCGDDLVGGNGNGDGDGQNVVTDWTIAGNAETGWLVANHYPTCIYMYLNRTNLDVVKNIAPHQCSAACADVRALFDDVITFLKALLSDQRRKRVRRCAGRLRWLLLLRRSKV